MSESTELSLDEAVQSLIEPVEEQTTDDVADTEDEQYDDIEDSTEGADDVDDDVDDEDADDSIDEDIEQDNSDEEGADLDSELYTVKVDGEEYQVTLDDLKRGYSGQQYVQQGMKQAAEARKQAEAVYNSFQQARNEVIALANQINSGGFLVKPTEPSRELFDSDPIGYMEAKLKYDDDIGNYNQQMQQVNQLQQQHQAAEQYAKQAMLQQEALQLKALIPELGDKEKASKWKERITETASSYGYSAEDLAGIVDHRAMSILNDAMKYREIMNGKSKAEVKVKGAKPVVKAGSKRKVDVNAATRKKQQQKLAKSGKIEDAVSLIMNI